MKETRDDLERLATYVIDARVRAGFTTREELAAVTGVTARTLGKLETAEAEVSGRTLARVAEAVGWTPDSPQLVMSGREPRPRLSVVSSAEDDGQNKAKAAAVVFPDDPVAQAIVNQTGKDPEVIRRELAAWLGRNNSAAQA